MIYGVWGSKLRAFMIHKSRWRRLRPPPLHAEPRPIYPGGYVVGAPRAPLAHLSAPLCVLPPGRPGRGVCVVPVRLPVALDVVVGRHVPGIDGEGLRTALGVGTAGRLGRSWVPLSATRCLAFDFCCPAGAAASRASTPWPLVRCGGV